MDTTLKYLKQALRKLQKKIDTLQLMIEYNYADLLEEERTLLCRIKNENIAPQTAIRLVEMLNKKRKQFDSFNKNYIKNLDKYNTLRIEALELKREITTKEFYANYRRNHQSS